MLTDQSKSRAAMRSWYLENAAVTAQANPYTFFRPSAEAIRKVAAGEIVKLIFCFESDDPSGPRAERMWVLVDSIDGQGGFTGKLDNQPRHIQDLRAGDSIVFRDIHIINTTHDDQDNLVSRHTARCFVTNRVLRDGLKVGYLYREEPDYDDDSGWRIMAGDEGQEYMDDAKNLAYVSLGSILNLDDSFVDLLDAEVGTEFERAEGGNGFIRLD